jgi:hypothetical protein
MRTISVIVLLLFFFSCRSEFELAVPAPEGVKKVSGSAFYKQVWSADWRKRDSIAVDLILAGDIPSFFKKFSKVTTSIIDSSTGKVVHAYYFVSNDYVSVGTDEDWARIPLTPQAAQKIADAWNCFLPTRKMVNDIHLAAQVKLEPVPMYIFRDSSVTMWQHHLIIEKQRKNQKGLISGIKKDVVISDKITRDLKKNRVAIYGWHKSDGKAIQPLYTGHVDWYVDYSHGVRMVSQTIFVEGKPMNYKEVMKHPLYKRLLCDEENCDVVRYDH